MNKPCYYMNMLLKDKGIMGDCEIDYCCFKEVGQAWETCGAGKKKHLIAIKRKKKIEQARLARAQKISKKIVQWAKHSKVQPYEPAFQRQITRIIKEELQREHA